MCGKEFENRSRVYLLKERMERGFVGEVPMMVGAGDGNGAAVCGK